jgi:hypothetical protein
MSQYNWNWWFVSSLILMACSCVIGMTEVYPKTATVMIIISVLNLIPCMYIGCKPKDN